jgi:uncharacterized protein DUF1329
MRTALVLGLLLLPTLASAGLDPGTVLDQTNAEEAKGLLPDEVYEHYRKGEYHNPIVDFPNARFEFDDGFAEATEWNRAHMTLDAAKQPVDRDTGKRPDYITGRPFPDIREDDPDAGIKILWNMAYGVFEGGNSRNVTELNWLSPTGVDRSSTQDVTFLFYDAQPKKYLPPSNSQNLLGQFLALTLGPADLQGTAALSWRYKDPGKRDGNWAYVPALRRIRAVSPTNRSDGFLGSDMSQDDGQFFDGKPEDFTWSVVGHRDALRLTDPDALAGKVVRRELPTGGWRTIFSNNDRAAGYQVKDWKGLAWAPVAAGLTKRKMWVIQGVPKDQYYLYGKLELWIDDYTFQGGWNRKFSWRGDLMNTYQVVTPGTHRFTDKEVWWGSTFGYQCAENVKANRATVAGLVPPGDVPNDRRIPLDPSFFDYQTLSRFGK